MQIADLENVKLHWREDGDPAGRPVVFANSLGTDLRLWDDVLSFLPGGLRFIRFDKRGHGLSSCPKGPYTIDDLAEDAAGLLDSLGVKGAIFVGLSIGGMVAQSLAARRPDLVRALVLSNTAARMGNADMWEARIAAIRDSGMEGIADAVLERWFSAAFLETGALEAWRNMLIRTPEDGYVACCHAIAGADLTETTRGLTLPTLGIAGSEDGASPPDLVAETVALIPGSAFHVIAGAGHLPCVEDPGTYAAHLNRFIEETAP